MIQFRRPGFSLLEITISVGIMALLAGLVIIYSSRGFTTDLNTAAAEVAQVLRDAREKTLASVDNTTWRVEFNGSTYSLDCNKVDGCDAENNYDLPEDLQFGSAYYIAFDRLTGYTGSNTTIVIEQIGNASETEEIFVTSTGSIGRDELSEPAIEWLQPKARLVKVLDRNAFSAGDIIDVKLFNEFDVEQSSGSINTSASDVQSGYYVFSGDVVMSAGSLSLSLVIEDNPSDGFSDYYVYFDPIELSGLGMKINDASGDIIRINTDGVVVDPTDTFYELF